MMNNSLLFFLVLLPYFHFIYIYIISFHFIAIFRLNICMFAYAMCFAHISKRYYNLYLKRPCKVRLARSVSFESKILSCFVVSALNAHWKKRVPRICTYIYNKR